MARGATTTQIIVIHRGQVVVHQRVDVNQLDRTGGRFDFVFSQPESMRGREYERRSDAFSTTQHAVPHGLVQSRGHHARLGKARSQRPLHPRLP